MRSRFWEMLRTSRPLPSRVQRRLIELTDMFGRGREGQVRRRWVTATVCGGGWRPAEAWLESEAVIARVVVRLIVLACPGMKTAQPLQIYSVAQAAVVAWRTQSPPLGSQGTPRRWGQQEGFPPSKKACPPRRSHDGVTPPAHAGTSPFELTHQHGGEGWVASRARA